MDLVFCNVFAGECVWNQFIFGKSGTWNVNRCPGKLRACIIKISHRDAIAQIPNFIDKHNLLYFRNEGIFLSGHVFSAFTTVVKLSRKFREQLLKSCNEVVNSPALKIRNRQFIVLRFYLVPCKQHVDYAWGVRVERLVQEKMELGNTMSWLSTFGGAFSALGEEVKDCALIAGRISMKQLSIALRLGDPLMVSRCKLYLALSLIQTGRLRRAKHIIQEQYWLVKSLPVLDKSVIRMCQGIWAKLKYSYQLQKCHHLKSATKTKFIHFHSKNS